MNCTRCEGTGFLNLRQVDEATLAKFDETGDERVIFEWLDTMYTKQLTYKSCQCPRGSGACSHCADLYHDVCLCDCCSDGEGWPDGRGQHIVLKGKRLPECY